MHFRDLVFMKKERIIPQLMQIDGVDFELGRLVVPGVLGLAADEFVLALPGLFGLDFRVDSAAQQRHVALAADAEVVDGVLLLLQTVHLDQLRVVLPEGELVRFRVTSNWRHGVVSWPALINHLLREG